MIIYIAIFAFILFFIERIINNKPFVKSKHWYPRAILLNLCTLLVFNLGAFTWDPYFQSLQFHEPIVNTSAPLQGLLCYIAFNFIFYWWHRVKHSNRLLWRVFHQVHHSPQRIEVLSTNYLHPLDALSSLLIGSALCYVFLGFNASASAWFTLYLGLMGYFIHSNIKVPRWVGYFIQTPQMHRMHHEYNKHKSNYCDVVWFDMLFGTYNNPKDEDVCDRCGFNEKRELRLKDMLAFTDVHQETEKNSD